jgi:hypothetical protein
VANTRRRFDHFLDQLEHYAIRLAVTVIVISWVAKHLWSDLLITWPSLASFHWP